MVITYVTIVSQHGTAEPCLHNMSFSVVKVHLECGWHWVRLTLALCRVGLSSLKYKVERM
jgi:hypothetical protein